MSAWWGRGIASSLLAAGGLGAWQQHRYTTAVERWTMHPALQELARDAVMAKWLRDLGDAFGGCASDRAGDDDNDAPLCFSLQQQVKAMVRCPQFRQARDDLDNSRTLWFRGRLSRVPRMQLWQWPTSWLRRTSLGTCEPVCASRDFIGSVTRAQTNDNVLACAPTVYVWWVVPVVTVPWVLAYIAGMHIVRPVQCNLPPDLLQHLATKDAWRAFVTLLQFDPALCEFFQRHGAEPRGGLPFATLFVPAGHGDAGIAEAAGHAAPQASLQTGGHGGQDHEQH
jgi:hypothetical protein